MSNVAEHYPRDYALNHEKLEYFTEKLFTAERKPYKIPDGFEFPNVTEPMNDWYREYAMPPLHNPEVYI